MHVQPLINDTGQKMTICSGALPLNSIQAAPSNLPSSETIALAKRMLDSSNHVLAATPDGSIMAPCNHSSSLHTRHILVCADLMKISCSEVYLEDITLRCHVNWCPRIRHAASYAEDRRKIRNDSLPTNFSLSVDADLEPAAGDSLCCKLLLPSSLPKCR